MADNLTNARARELEHIEATGELTGAMSGLSIIKGLVKGDPQTMRFSLTDAGCRALAKYRSKHAEPQP